MSNMRERRYTILSTASIPFEQITGIPDFAEIRVIPFIEILPRQDEETLSGIAGFGKQKLIAVFTSVHAVYAVTSCLKQKPDWTIYCVGKETLSVIRDWIGPGMIAKSANNAQALAEIMVADKIKEAVFFCGDQRMDILPENLRKEGLLLRELIVYSTLLSPVHLDIYPDAILFFSPSAVKSFFSVNDLPSETILFVPGKTTADTLSRFTTNKVIISSEPDKMVVLNLAVEYAVSHTITGI
jgi:uroporphyrinogen-III synthase